MFACAWLALAVVAPSASAAPSWVAPQDISGSTEATAFPEVSVNATGDAVAIWYRDVGSKTIVEAVERPAGGAWSEPVVLSDPAGENEPTNTHVALDTAGNAVAVWSVFDSGSTIRTAARPAGGEWSEPEDLSTAGGQTPQLAMNAAGEAVAVWNGFNGTDYVTWAATRPAGGDWSAPEDLSLAGEGDWWPPRVAIDADGNAIAVWERQILGEDVIRAAILPAGDDWSDPEDLSLAGDNAREPVIAMSAAGTAVAAWAVAGSGIQAAVRSPGGSWSASPEQVSAPGQSAWDPAVTIDSNGNAAALWQGPGTTGQVLRAAVRSLGGGWSAPKEVSDEKEGFVSYEIEAHASAGVVATWTSKLSPTPTYGVQAAVRPPGGGWSEPEDLSAEGENAGLPDLGFDAAGNAVAIWGREVGAHDYVLQGAGYDFAAPRLDDLQIPATGTVGVPVSFAVSPFDVFSLGATNWAFGDDGAASGNAVSHTYTTPGRYPVTVSALDASGNAGRQTQTIAIAPGPIGPPPPRRQIALDLRVEGQSLQKLMRTGTLSVAASVNDTANVALSGRARLKVHARGRTKTRLVSVFTPKTVRLDAAVEGKVALALSKRGRKALQSLSRVKLLVAGEARDDAGGTAAVTAARTLR